MGKGYMKLKLFGLVERLPENRLTAPLKKRADAAMEAEVAAVKQEILRTNWEKVKLHRELRRMLAEEGLPEEKREYLEEMDRKLVELIDGMAELLKKAEDIGNEMKEERD